jgi:LemA protein
MSVLAWSGIFLVVLLFYLVATYNRLVVMRNNVKESWSAIETELRRRFDLIPNIVETVKGYASHERETLEAVIKARNSAVSNLGSPEALAGSQNVLSNALGKLIALSEAYPQLKANENFNQLQAELGDTETRISQARRFYNANVRDYNSSLESFPNVLFAASLGFKPQVFFGIEDPAAFEPVKVSFGSAPADNSSQSIKLKTAQPAEEPDKLP